MTRVEDWGPGLSVKIGVVLGHVRVVFEDDNGALGVVTVDMLLTEEECQEVIRELTEALAELKKAAEKRGEDA